MAELSDYKEQLQKLFNKNNYSGAREFIKQLISRKTEQDKIAEYYYDLARIEKWENNLEKARQFISTAIKLSKENHYFFLEHALILEKLGNYTEAAKIYSLLEKGDENFNFLKDKIVEISDKLLETKFPNEKNELIELLQNRIILRKKTLPLISIIILGYNKIEYSQKCIESILQNTSYPNYEIIFLDNASADRTSTIIESYGKNVRYIRSKTNLGFVNGNNYTAKFASGEFIVFLNNDTEVQKEWLNSLYNTFIYHPDAGAVGSKLIYPDGRLQEAGGVIFNDATGWNFGKGDDPNFYLYDFTREVDYCSGAALMVRRNIFENLGGFDEQFAPAYYEDTDLCFSIRKLGYKVYYCHSSIVVHKEGATAGTDLNKGFKKFQIINRPKFINKWKNELKKQYPPDPALKLKFFNRNKSKKILIIDDIPPLPNQAAGALRHYHTLKQMLNLGYQVTYVHLMGKKYFGKENFKYFHEFKSKGVEFIWFNYEYWWEFRKSPKIKQTLKKLIEALDLKVRQFHYIYIAFWHIAEYFIDFIKEEIPETPILIDTMDVHFLREIREAEMKNSPKLLFEAKKNKERELSIYRKADCITTVTLKDREILKKELPDKPIFILTDVHDPVENVKPFAERKDLVFVGNFSHKPNEDAVIFFLKEIFPIIKEKEPTIKFYVVGNNPPETLLSFKNESVIVTGWVPEVEPYLEKCRLSVIPLRFGAGNKGKVGQALAHGLPMVTTSIGAEGMGIVNYKHALVSDNPTEFAEMVVKLYNNEELWNKLSSNGQKLISSIYTSKLMRNRLRYIFSFDTKEKLRKKFAIENPEPNYVSVIIPSYNNKEYLESAVESIRLNDYPQIELIIIDNNSDAETLKYLKKIKYEENVKVIFNEKNEGFPKAVNRGILESNGKYILIANNDVIAPPMAIKRMVEIADENPEIGIVGTVSNYVSGPQFDSEAKYESPDRMQNYAREVAAKRKGQLIHFPRVAFLFTLIKSEVVEKIGGLDERFTPGNFEDDDFCLRAQLSGFKTVIAQDVFVHHFGSVSFKKENKFYDELIQKNLNIFIEKWGASPEDIWLNGKKFNSRNLFFPIYSLPFETYFERTLLLSEEGDLIYAAKELEEAIKYFDNYKGIKFKNITRAELFHLAGTIYLNLNNFEKAAEFFEMESAEEPDSLRPLESMAQTYLKAGLTDAAKEISRALVEIDPTNKVGQMILNKE